MQGKKSGSLYDADKFHHSQPGGILQKKKKKKHQKEDHRAIMCLILHSLFINIV